MLENYQAASQALPPHVQLIQMGGAYRASTIVYAAAKLGLADQLATGPKSAAELAGPMGAHAPSLHRLMRTLASLGILTEQPEQRYKLTTLGEALKTGGGATGNMLAAILTHHAGPRGLLFDRPHVVGDAPALLKAKDVSDRMTIEAGDFFKSVPVGGDAYVLSHIIHDWSEDECPTILGHVHNAMKPDSRLLIVEMVLPAGDTPHLGKMLDITMLVVVGGQERTETEYGLLLRKAGFRLTRVVPTNSAVSIVEAVLA